MFSDRVGAAVTLVCAAPLVTPATVAGYPHLWTVGELPADSRWFDDVGNTGRELLADGRHDR